MSNISISFDNISKQYRLGTIGTGTISHDLNRWWHVVRGKEDPYLKIGETNDRSKKGTSDYVWALKDITFNVNQGEVVGIIGKNGAGKSTLLKLLSRVTSPSTGSIKARGRIASLLEVGTGFHQEMTGRENIFMNGAIMGMTKVEIKNKLDEIVDFAGIERYIDTPVKRYSSGMTVRLGFAIAAHLDPEILVVDEVLAVGDAEFQKKAIGKMKDVSQTGGRTVLFVSHNMTAVKNLCDRGVVLKDGSVAFDGSISDAIDDYLREQDVRSKIPINDLPRSGDGLLHFVDMTFLDADNKEKYNFEVGESIKVVIDYVADGAFYEQVSSRVDIGINDIYGNRVSWMSTTLFQDRVTGRNQICFELEELLFVPGIYNLTIYAATTQGISDWVHNASSFTVIPADFYGTGRGIPEREGYIMTKFKIEE